MKTKWTDCSALQDLAAAQARGDEIDVYAGGEWSIWDETVWHEREEYRCRPAKTNDVRPWHTEPIAHMYQRYDPHKATCRKWGQYIHWIV